jgi:hypothetical protein
MKVPKYYSVGRKSVSLLEGSHAMPSRSSDEDRMRVKVLELLDFFILELMYEYIQAVIWRVK